MVSPGGRRRNRAPVLALLVLSAIITSSCSSDDGKKTATQGAGTTTTAKDGAPASTTTSAAPVSGEAAAGQAAAGQPAPGQPAAGQPTPGPAPVETAAGEAAPGQPVDGQPVADIAAVKGSACGYYVNVGLFGGPQNLRGCDQTAGTQSSSSPKVTLPESGGEESADDPDGATAQYGPARIFSGKWPDHVSSAPPSGPISVRTQGTIGADGSASSSVDIVLRDPPNADSPGGFGPGPVQGDELHVSCKADATGVTGSTTFSNGLLSTSTDVEGSPLDQEAIPDNPPVNYTRGGVITNVGDVFAVVFNEQIVNPDGSLTVNAFHMYLFGPVAVGESIGGQVTCGTTPTTATPNDTVEPTCGIPVVEPLGPEDPTPKVPRTELIGVFDAGGLESISNIQVSNGIEQIGNPSAGQAYLEFRPGQTGPLPITFARTDEAEAQNLPMFWSFDATDAAGNTTHCRN